MRVAHTVVVVSVPGLGDDVQALKAASSRSPTSTW